MSQLWRFFACGADRAGWRLWIPLALLALAAGCATAQRSSIARSPAAAEPRAPGSLGEPPASGPKNATVVIEEFLDFGCINCRSQLAALDRLIQRHGSAIRIEYRPFAKNAVLEAPGFDSHASNVAAAAMLAAHLQGYGVEMMRRLFGKQLYYDAATIAGHAAALGLDSPRFERDRASEAVLEAVRANKRESIRRDVRGTPTLFVNGRRLEGLQSFETLDAYVRESLGAKAGGPPALEAALPPGQGPLWGQMIYPVEPLAPLTARPALKTGDRAPDFDLPSVSGQRVKLSEYRGKKTVVLTFVPSAFTPVCSSQWPHYGANEAIFAQYGAVVVGVTTDNIPTLYAWTLGMPQVRFPVLSDFWPHGAVSKAYGVLRPESGVAERALFVIDAEGIVRYIDIHDINSEPSLPQLIETLRQLAARP